MLEIVTPSGMLFGPSPLEQGILLRASMLVIFFSSGTALLKATSLRLTGAGPIAVDAMREQKPMPEVLINATDDICRATKKIKEQNLACGYTLSNRLFNAASMNGPSI